MNATTQRDELDRAIEEMTRDIEAMTKDLDVLRSARHLIDKRRAGRNGASHPGPVTLAPPADGSASRVTALPAALVTAAPPAAPNGLRSILAHYRPESLRWYVAETFIDAKEPFTARMLPTLMAEPIARLGGNERSYLGALSKVANREDVLVHGPIHDRAYALPGTQAGDILAARGGVRLSTLKVQDEPVTEEPEGNV